MGHQDPTVGSLPTCLNLPPPSRPFPNPPHHKVSQEPLDRSNELLQCQEVVVNLLSDEQGYPGTPLPHKASIVNSTKSDMMQTPPQWNGFMQSWKISCY